MSDELPDLSDEADAALLALAGAGGGEGMISARQDASNLLVSTGPDVLWTPRGGGKVAVPYSVVAPMDSSIQLSTSVRNNGNYDFQLNSRTTKIIGHEPGTLKGVVEPGYQKYSHVEVGADFLFSEGFANVSHGDPAWINRDEVGPAEPQRDESEQFITYVSSSTSSASPYGALTANPSGGNAASPGAVEGGGSASPYGGLPNSINSVSPQGVQSPFGPPNVPISARSRRGGGPNHSHFRRNARGRTNVNATAVPKFATDLMTDLSKNQHFTPDQAAGFAGNAGGESGNFTKFHEIIAAKNGVPQHQAHPREGGRGVIQWTASRRNQFKQLIGSRENKEADPNVDFPDSDYSNYGNNEAMIEDDLNGEYSGAANSIRSGDTSDVPTWAQGNNLSVATWHDFSQYEKPGVYGAWAKDPDNASKTRAVQREFDRRLGLAKKYLDDYRKQLAKTGGG